MNFIPFGFSYRLDYVPAGKRKIVSTEVEGRAMAAIEEIPAEDAPVVIKVDDNVRGGKDRSFSIRAAGNDLLWPFIDHLGDSFMTKDTFMRTLAEGTAWSHPYGQMPVSLKLRRLATEADLKIQRLDYSDEDIQIAVVQRRLAQLRICSGQLWIVGVEPVYYLSEDKYFTLVKPPSPTVAFTAQAPIWEMTDLGSRWTAFGSFYSLDEVDLAATKTNTCPTSWPYAEVKDWSVRTDPVRLQLRSVLDTLLSTYALHKIPQLSADVGKTVSWMERLRTEGAMPTVEDGAAAMIALMDFYEHNGGAVKRSEGARHFLRNMMESVENSLAIRGRPSPFPLSDKDDDFLASLAS